LSRAKPGNPKAYRNHLQRPCRKKSPRLEIALVLVHFDHVASVIINANHSMALSGEALHENQAPPD